MTDRKPRCTSRGKFHFRLLFLPKVPIYPLLPRVIHLRSIVILTPARSSFRFISYIDASTFCGWPETTMSLVTFTPKPVEHCCPGSSESGRGVYVHHLYDEATRYLNFWCGKVFEGGQVTFLIHFENVILVRLNTSHPHQKCRFEQFQTHQKCNSTRDQ